MSRFFVKSVRVFFGRSWAICLLPDWPRGLLGDRNSLACRTLAIQPSFQRARRISNPTNARSVLERFPTIFLTGGGSLRTSVGMATI